MEGTDITEARSVIDASAGEKGAYRMSRFEIKDMRELSKLAKYRGHRRCGSLAL